MFDFFNPNWDQSSKLGSRNYNSKVLNTPLLEQVFKVRLFWVQQIEIKGITFLVPILKSEGSPSNILDVYYYIAAGVKRKLRASRRSS